MTLTKTIQLFQCDTKAKDGSVIPSEVVRTYLASPEYQEVNESNLILGGITHKDRTGDKSFKGIGIDDPALINKNTIFRINNVRFHGLKIIADLTVFDPDLFTGPIVDDINFVQGLLRSGVALTGSVVIDGKWDKDEVLKKLNCIVGWDITLNPSYKNSGVKN